MTGNMIDYDIIGFASIALVSLMSLLMALRFKEIDKIIIGINAIKKLGCFFI